MKSLYNREAYGEEIVELGKQNKDIVVLDADISSSTKTCYFAKAYPERFFNVGVAEQNEMVIAGGLASTGLIPFVSTYAIFASMRACEQVRTFICYPKLNVKIVVTHGGITASEDGVTHQATEDLSIMRAMPNLTVIVPTDYNLTKSVIRTAVKHKGPMYIRLTRNKLPAIYDKDIDFKIGKSIKLFNGSDLTLISIGDMTHIAMEAAVILKQKGISAALIDMPTLKPIDKEAIIKAAKDTGAIVTIEDNQIVGGLGSAVAEVISENCPVPLKRIGLNDTFTESGEYKLLLDKYCMSPNHIVKAATEIITKKFLSRS